MRAIFSVNFNFTLRAKIILITYDDRIYKALRRAVLPFLLVTSSVFNIFFLENLQLLLKNRSFYTAY